MATRDGNARRQRETSTRDGNGSEEIFSYRTFSYAAIFSLVYTTAASEGEGPN